MSFLRETLYLFTKKKGNTKNLGLKKINTHYMYINERSNNFIKVTRKRKNSLYFSMTIGIK